MTEPNAPAPRTVGGRYELGDLLGRGGMAEVRRAVDNRLGRPVAVKQLRADLATDPTFQARFRREAQSAAGLNHPNIVAVYDTGEEPDAVSGVSVPYIVMELVEGPTLRDVLREGRKILPERALELTAGVLDALTYSHRAGIVHRDIKPANVMLTHSGNVKVMDFGIARAVADTSATMTQTAAVIGTAQYLSPEQARGETVDARSDLYSAGCLMYELLVGKPPFTGESPVSVAYQHVREAPVPPSQIDPTLSNEIDTIVLKALAKEPDDRYQSAREMKADITLLLAGEEMATTVRPAVLPTDDSDATRVVPAALPADPVEDEGELPGSGPDDLDEEDEEKKRRAPMVVAIIVGVLLLLSAAGVWAWNWMQPDQAQPAPPPVQVEVPTVTGMDRTRAESEIEAAGLEADISSVNGKDDQTVNTAVTQQPEAGTKVDKGTTVEVEVNIGPKTATVPDDLVGKKAKRVENQLADAGFDKDNIERVDPSQPEPLDAEKNQVLAIDPEEGETVATSSDITLTVATGKSEVPDLTGMLEDRASRTAESAGFRTKVVEKEDEFNAAGTVIEQDVEAGSQLERGSTIEIVVAKEPPEPTPPPETSAPPSSEPSDEPSDEPTDDGDDEGGDDEDKTPPPRRPGDNG